MDFFMQQHGSPAAQGTQGVVYRQEGKAIKVFRPDKPLTEISREAYIMALAAEKQIPIFCMTAVAMHLGMQVWADKYVEFYREAAVDFAEDRWQEWIPI